MARKKSDPGKPSTAWQGTYGDMITLMLCFFVMLYDPSDADAVMMAAMQASIQNTLQGGGQSLSAGRLSDLGNTVSSLPSNERGSSLGPAKKKAISIFEPDIKSNRITITSDERGLVISLASDSFFEKGSANYNAWYESCQAAENAYFKMLNNGATPQEARSVLPNSLKTEIIVTMNYREWRHFFKLRAARLTGPAHPQMEEITIPLLNEIKKLIPVVFDDIIVEY